MNQDKEICALCRQPAKWNDPLDVHHIFGGSFRKKSEYWGAVCKLHHNSCHIFGPNAVHNNVRMDRKLKRAGQRAIMREYGWSIEQFRNEFGKNYI